MKSTYRLQSSLYCVVCYSRDMRVGRMSDGIGRERKKKIYIYIYIYIHMVICDVGQGREREEISVKTPIMHSNTTFFSGCLLDTCVDPHKRVISFYHLLKKYIKREDNLISHST